MKINIPFNEWSKERLKAGKKTATSRTKRYGKVGDFFKVDGKMFVLVEISERSLFTVSTRFFAQEGADSAEEFIEVWNSIHPKKKFDPHQVIYFHEFTEIDQAHSNCVAKDDLKLMLEWAKRHGKKTGWTPGYVLINVLGCLKDLIKDEKNYILKREKLLEEGK